MEKIKKIGDFLAGGSILFYTLPWLMILTVIGTVIQKNIGLYDAINHYFHSFIAWFGPIPTPGGLSLLGLIFISLSINFLFYSNWSWRKAGINLSHFGILILLFGGILTITTKKEGFMIIPEGEEKNYFADYHERVVKIGDNILDFSALEKGQLIEIEDISFKILDKCDNCSARAPSGIYGNLQGLAVNMELYAIPSRINKEANFSGLVFEIIKPEENAGTYMIMEDISKNPIIKEQEIKLTRAKTQLPFSIALQDFRKIDYPGTFKAREFESDIIVQDNNTEWPVTISMNKPLRYKGYTFYQSSFDQNTQGEVTVLTAVENVGRIFPYLSTFIVLVGLLLHCFIRVRKTA
jgi:hypothetical protein